MKPYYCKKCGKLYNKIRSVYCGECLDYIDSQFVLVRDYISEKPKASIKEIIEETKVEEKILLHLLREERLTVVAEPSIPCKGCGKLINSGAYCENCSTRINDNIEYLKKMSSPINADKCDKEYTKKDKSKTGGIHISRD